LPCCPAQLGGGSTIAEQLLYYTGPRPGIERLHQTAITTISDQIDIAGGSGCNHRLPERHRLEQRLR
jgi:hypothetical protein